MGEINLLDPPNSMNDKLDQIRGLSGGSEFNWNVNEVEFYLNQTPD